MNDTNQEKILAEFKSKLRSVVESIYRRENPDVIWINPQFLNRIADILIEILWDNTDGVQDTKIEAFIEASISTMSSYGANETARSTLKECWSKIQCEQ